MATVRKRERRMTLMSTKVKAVKREGQVMPESNSVITLSPSPMATRSFRGETATQQLNNTEMNYSLTEKNKIFSERLVARALPVIGAAGRRLRLTGKL